MPRPPRAFGRWPPIPARLPAHEHLAEIFGGFSGWGGVFVVFLIAARWGAPKVETTEIVDSNEGLTQALGWAPPLAWVRSGAGARVSVMLLRRALSALGFEASLLCASGGRLLGDRPTPGSGYD